MITFNKETLTKLSKFEQYFHTVLDLQYIRATSKDMIELLELYQSVGGKVKNFSAGCYQCRYNLVREVGLAYRASVKAEAEAEAAAQAAAQAEAEAEKMAKNNSEKDGKESKKSTKSTKSSSSKSSSTKSSSSKSTKSKSSTK